VKREEEKMKELKAEKKKLEEEFKKVEDEYKKLEEGLLELRKKVESKREDYAKADQEVKAAKAEGAEMDRVITRKTIKYRYLYLDKKISKGNSRTRTCVGPKTTGEESTRSETPFTVASMQITGHKHST
jgi:chromosome segregation ATPase